VISEHSVNSPWCEKEWSLAVTLGIQSKQVKVLPVRLDGAVVPSFLADTRWADANSSGCRAVAAELATAMKGHLERRLGAAVIKPGSSSPVPTTGIWRIESPRTRLYAGTRDLSSSGVGCLNVMSKAMERQQWHLAA
jgi:hypothetical protein